MWNNVEGLYSNKENGNHYIHFGKLFGQYTLKLSICLCKIEHMPVLWLNCSHNVHGSALTVTSKNVYNIISSGQILETA